MTPTELLETIYLGDRACKSISLDGWKNQVVVQVDTISRIRNDSGLWGFYTEEDIPNGCLVFSEVSEVRLSPSGPLPNDFINDLTVEESVVSTVEKPIYIFTLYVGSIDKTGRSTEVVVEIKAGDLYLQDPLKPATQIRE